MRDTSTPVASGPAGLQGAIRQVWGQVMDGLFSLRAKLVLPYVLLVLLLAFGGIYIITRLVTSSVRERFVNQLYQAGRVSADAVVRTEQDQLSLLRLMTFTVGVPSAIQRNDSQALTNLLLPLALNGGAEAVVVVNDQGRQVMGIIRPSPEESFIATQTGADFSTYDFVQNVLDGETDAAGDKFVGLIETPEGIYLFTSGPVQDQDGNLIGGMLVGTRADTLARELKSQALADILMLDRQGHLVATTFPDLQETAQLREELMASLSAGGTSVQLEEFEMSGRPYQAAYTPWIAREQIMGTMGVVLPSNFVVSAEATSRNLISLIFALGTVAVIVVGYLISQNIARPILHLRSMAQAVAAGDLEQASGLIRSDEIGDLAEAFDVMTARLHARTEEAQQLYEETIERNQQLAEMYERLQSAQQQLVQSEKLAAVGQLAAGIVHDVKNPLGVIKGMAEELMIDTDGRPEMEQGLKIIRDNASRANLIVTDLLKFARQSTPSMQQRDLRTTVEGCLRLTDYLIRKGKVDAISELPDQAVWLTYDSQQIEQVIINLIQNAVQAMPEGGELMLRLTDGEDEAMLRVEDSGVGIPKENLVRIFEPFFTTKPEGQGTGMGLAVSYGIISRHGGRIDVESSIGEGTAFTISLPKEIPAQSQLHQSEALA